LEADRIDVLEEMILAAEAKVDEASTKDELTALKAQLEASVSAATTMASAQSNTDTQVSSAAVEALEDKLQAVTATATETKGALLEFQQKEQQTTEEAKERVNSLEAWVVEVEAKVDSNIEETTASLQTLKAEFASRQEEMLTKMDADGDGTIDKSEFTQWASAQGARVEQLEGRLESAIVDAQAAMDLHGEATLRLESLEGASETGVTALAALKEELSSKLETKERVDGLEEWFLQVETKLDTKVDDLVAVETKLSECVATHDAFVTGQAAKLEQNLTSITSQLEELAQSSEATAASVEEQSAVGDLIEEQLQSSREAQDKLQSTVTALAKQQAGAGDVHSAIEKNRLHTEEVVKTMGSLKTEIDEVKFKVALNDKLDARMMNVKVELAENADQASKLIGDLKGEMRLFTTQIERRQGDVEALTKRIISTSDGKLDKVRVSLT
jgi:chromosome segregation ATPase